MEKECPIDGWTTSSNQFGVDGNPHLLDIYLAYSYLYYQQHK